MMDYAIKMKNEIVSIDDLRAITYISSLSKQQDTFPFEIVNFQVLLKAFENGNFITTSKIIFNIQSKLGINNIKRTRLLVGVTHYDPEVH